jgi:UDP-N-acetyl-D-mannosaminuronic acid dehydrogenase
VSFNTICVVGLGYIGLPTAAMFASKEIKVIGIDVNQSVVNTINKGGIHIVEPKLDSMVSEAIQRGFLRASLIPECSDAFLIAVPTPFLPTPAGDSIPVPDVTYIQSAVKSIASVLKRGDLVILESTSPVGTTEKIASWLADYRPDLTFPQANCKESDIRIAYCPERVLPGHVITELVENDRIIGGMTEKCSEKAIELYNIFVEGEFYVTTTRTAEMAKLTENASRDVSIAFANELSIICDQLDIDVWDLINVANRHPRVNILKPGPGVGGHCIAVDPWFIVSAAPKHSKLIQTARAINDAKPAWVIEQLELKIVEYFSDHPSQKHSDLVVACYGLAFKADIDDLRESPALDILRRVTKLNAGVTLAVEPNILELPHDLADVELVQFEDAHVRAHIHLILVDHKSFKERKFWGDYLIDTRGISKL